MNDNASKRVGEVCDGSCAAVFLQNKMFIITCRHVALHDDLNGIPLFNPHLKFKERIYDWGVHLLMLVPAPVETSVSSSWKTSMRMWITASRLKTEHCTKEWT
jgi:hypothetical protein